MKKKDCKPFILDETFVGFSDKSSDGRKPKIYTLNMILSVGHPSYLAI